MGVAFAPQSGEAFAPLHAIQAPAEFVVHQQPTYMNLEQNVLEELRARKGRPLDLQWQGAGGQIFAECIKRGEEPLIRRFKRLEFPPSWRLGGFPPKSA